MHVWFIKIKGHFGKIAGKNMVRPFFLPFKFFCFVGIQGYDFWVYGRAGHPGPAHPSQQVGVEVFNVGGWLTHVDSALETRVDLLSLSIG